MTKSKDNLYQTKPVVKLTAAEKVIECFKNHIDKNRKLVFDDFLVDDGLLDCVYEADDVLISEFEDLELELSSDEMIAKLIDEQQEKEILRAMDLDVVLDFVKERTPDYIIFKVTSMADQEKIKAFIETEIYPYLLDQKVYLPWV